MKIGFIGCGNMGKAIVSGILGKGLVPAEDIYASESKPEIADAVKEKFGINTCCDNALVASTADVLVLAVKPQVLPDVIPGIKDSIKDDTLIISICAGKRIKTLEDMFGRPVKLVRVMPNTPALVNEGMSGFCMNERVTEEDAALAKSILESFGKARMVTEDLMDAVTALSGSSPAYIFMVIQAMTESAVSMGIPYDDALVFASQAVYGSAKLAMESDDDPLQLRINVCSPGGTTIEAVKVFEEKGLMDIIKEGMEACRKRSSEL